MTSERDDFLIKMREHVEDLACIQVEKAELVESLNVTGNKLHDRDAELKQMKQEVEASGVKMNMLSR